MPAREAQITGLARDGLLSVTREEQRVVLRFRGEAGLRRRIDQLVEAESSCCAFLDFRVEHTPGASLLAIAAPPGGEATLHGLAALFAPAG